MLGGLKALSADCRGAVVIEYGLIAALISVVIVAGVSSIGVTTQGFYNTIASAVSAAL